MNKNSVRNVPRQTRSQQTMDLILDTAAELFVNVGYENATTNAIAEKAGISIGALYRYFPDIAAASCSMDKEMIDNLANFFRMLVPDLDEKRAHRLAAVSKATVKMLISLVLASRDEDYQAEIIADVKQMLLGYLGPVLHPEA